MVRLGAVAVVACVFLLALFTSSSSAGKGPMVTDVVSKSAHTRLYIITIHVYEACYTIYALWLSL